jgi:hypothetical protein
MCGFQEQWNRRLRDGLKVQVFDNVKVSGPGNHLRGACRVAGLDGTFSSGHGVAGNIMNS